MPFNAEYPDYRLRSIAGSDQPAILQQSFLKFSLRSSSPKYLESSA